MSTSLLCLCCGVLSLLQVIRQQKQMCTGGRAPQQQPALGEAIVHFQVRQVDENAVVCWRREDVCYWQHVLHVKLLAGVLGCTLQPVAFTRGLPSLTTAPTARWFFLLPC